MYQLLCARDILNVTHEMQLKKKQQKQGILNISFVLYEYQKFDWSNCVYMLSLIITIHCLNF